MPIQLTLFKKGLILVSVPLLTQLAFLGLFAQMQRSNAEAQGWFTHTKDVIAQTQRVRGALIEVEGIIRSRTRGEAAYAETLERATHGFLAELEPLKGLVHDNPEQEARAVALGESASQLLASLRTQTGLTERGLTSQARLDDLRHQLSAFLQEEEHLDWVRRQHLERSQQQFRLLLLGGGLVAILSTGLLAYGFGRGIGRRLNVLTLNAQRLGAGKELLPPVSGGDEIARVDRAFRRMAEELARSENALRSSERRFRLLVESVQDYAILMLDPDGRITTWNAGAERIKGYRTDEIIGQHFSCFYPEEARERGWPEAELKHASAEGRFEDEGWRVRKDGSRFWANVIFTAIYDESGCLRGFSKVTRDLSERKEAEQAIRRLNEELEQRVAERTASLDRANRDLMQKNRENELFVYSVSHDLRSPLVNLEGFSEELGMVSQDLRDLLADDNLPSSVRQRGVELLDGDMTESIRFIRSGVRRLSTIIDGLLQLSRAGRVVYHFQAVEVSAVVARVVESLHGTIAERGATVTVAELPAVWGDAVAVEQIFANLIGNALNYLDPLRPGLIEVGSTDIPAEEGGAGEPARRTFYVKDNGLGIPAAYHSKIFQAFQRLHPAAAKGEGIGLSLVRRLVERLGGRIWFQSTEGVGSTFFVSLADLPADDPSQPHRTQASGTTEQEQLHDRATVLDPVGGGR